MSNSKWRGPLNRQNFLKQNAANARISVMIKFQENLAPEPVKLLFRPFQWQSVVEIKINKTSKQSYSWARSQGSISFGLFQFDFCYYYFDYFSCWSSSTGRILINIGVGEGVCVHFQVFMHSLIFHLSVQKLKTDIYATVLMNAHYQ